MQKFLILFLISLLGFSSCKTFELTDSQPITSDKKTVENRYFESPEIDYVYRSKIEVYGKQISGILIIKKITETSHRVALTSDFGNKLMDFEISEKEFKVNYVIPDLDKKMVKKFLERDFRLLLKNQYSVIKSFENPTSKIYLSKEGNQHYYLHFNKENELLSKIVLIENKKEKINFNFVPKTPIFADEIELIHQDIKLKIKLFQITNN